MIPYDTIFQLFFDKLEADPDFFDLYELTPEENMQIAQERASTYLHEAVVKFQLAGEMDFMFALDDENQVINNELNDIELDILASLMFEKYMSKDVVKLKKWSVNFSPADLQVFSPANERTSFMNMYEALKKENKTMLHQYFNTDRNTLKKKTLDYSGYSQ